MYHFAIVVLLGLATYKVAGFLFGLVGKELTSSTKTFVTLVLGIVTAEILDYSVFAGWGVALQDAWTGPIFTGLVIGAMAYVWHETLGYLAARAGHTAGGDTLDTRPKAA